MLVRRVKNSRIIRCQVSADTATRRLRERPHRSNQPSEMYADSRHALN